MRTGGFSTPSERPNSFYPIYFSEITNEISLDKKDGFIEILPIDSVGQQRVWRKTPPSFIEHLNNNEINIVKRSNGTFKVEIIDRIKEGTRPKSVWLNSKYDASSHGTKLIQKMMPDVGFSFPKSIFIFACDVEISGTVQE